MLSISIRAPRVGFAGALLSLALACASLSVAQEPVQGFGDVYNVNLVEVDVIAVDSKGHPIVDLKRENFRLFEDGEPVEITNFFTVVDGSRPGLIPELPDSPEPLYLVIYVDELNLSMAGRDRTLRQVEEFVTSELRSSDRAMVVVSGEQTRIVHGLTEDFGAIAETLSGLRGQVSRGNAADLDRRTILSQLTERVETDAIAAQSILDAIDSYAQNRFNLMQATTSHLERLMADLGGIPGRKALLFVSDNLRNRPGEDLLQVWEAKFAPIRQEIGSASIVVQADRYDTHTMFASLVDKANTSRVTFYSIGAEERPTSDLAGPYGSSQGVDRALGFLSGATGGRSLVGRSSQGLLQLMRQDFDSYYSLGYAQPDRSGEGKHQIHVEIVGRDGVRLHHRDRYQARSRADRTADRTRTALVLGVAENDIGLELELEPATEADDGYRIPILVKMPLSKIVLIPEGEYHTGSITIFVTAQDMRGRSSEVQRFQFPIRLPNERMNGAMSQMAGYRVSLLLRPEEHMIAVGVQDDRGIGTAVVRSRWAPGDIPESPGTR